MTPATVMDVAQMAIETTMLVAGPMLILSLVVGLFVGAFQAMTQINEATLTFVPKIITVFLVILIGWYLTDKVVEPRLQANPVDSDLVDLPSMEPLAPLERKGLRAALWAMLVGILLLVASTWPESSAWRGASGSLTERGAPLMASTSSMFQPPRPGSSGSCWPSPSRSSNLRPVIPAAWESDV